MEIQDLAALKQQRDALEKQIEALESQERAKALVQIRELIKASGLTAEDVFGHGGNKSKAIRLAKGKAKSSPAKYRHPDNADLTWTGVGRKPKWLIDALASGKTLDSFAV